MNKIQNRLYHIGVVIWIFGLLIAVFSFTIMQYISLVLLFAGFSMMIIFKFITEMINIENTREVKG